MGNLIDELKEQLAPKQDNKVKDNKEIFFKMLNIMGTTSFNQLFTDDLLDVYNTYCESFKKL